MRYRTKITYLAEGKQYDPGTLLPPDLPAGDIAFLRSKGFVEPADVGMEDDSGEESGCSPDGEESDCSPDGEESGCSPDGMDGFSAFEGIKLTAALKSPDEIMRIRSKKDVFHYAASVGCDLGENYEDKSLKELQEEVIRFQEGMDEKPLQEEEYDIERAYAP